MKQSRIESFIEVGFNYLSGFVLAWAVYAFVVMPSPWLSASPLAVTTLFTAVSVVRSYFWRRVFNARLHLAAHRLARRLQQQRRGV